MRWNVPNWEHYKKSILFNIYSKMPTFVVFFQFMLMSGAMVTIFTLKWFFTSVNPNMSYHITPSLHNFLAKRTFVFWVIPESDGFSLQNMNKRFSDLKEGLTFLIRLITNCRPAGFFTKQSFCLASEYLKS